MIVITRLKCNDVTYQLMISSSKTQNPKNKT